MCFTLSEDSMHCSRFEKPPCCKTEHELSTEIWRLFTYLQLLTSMNGSNSFRFLFGSSHSNPKRLRPILAHNKKDPLHQVIHGTQKLPIHDCIPQLNWTIAIKALTEQSSPINMRSPSKLNVMNLQTISKWSWQSGNEVINSFEWMLFTSFNLNNIF